MNRVITSLLTVLFITNSYSQTKISGRILSNDKKCIHLANITIPRSNIGTITNETGNFELSLPLNYTKKKLQISCIGYISVQKSIDSLIKLNSPFTIILNKQSYSLSEIIIRKTEILKNPQQIFANAIDAIPRLLDPNPNIGKYYFRQIHRDDSTMNRIIEAAVSIYDPGIKQDITKCKFNVEELQSSLDNRVIDYKILLELYKYLLKKKEIKPDTRINLSDSYKDPVVQKYLLETFDKYKSKLSSYLIKSNMIRGTQHVKRKKSLVINPYSENGRPIITKSFIKEHNFKLDTILLFNHQPIYKIKILPNRKYPKIKYQEHSLIPIGTAYIRIKDFALLDLDYAYIKNPNYKHFNGRLSYYYRFKMQFKEYNNKLYLSYLYSMQSDYNQKFYVKEKRGKQRVIQELMNTEIILDPEYINQQLTNLKWNGNQYQKLPYNKEFWENYSTILPTQQEELLKDNLLKEIKSKKKRDVRE